MTELSISLTPELPAYIRDRRVRGAWTSPGLLVELAINAAPLPILSEVRFGDALPAPGSAERLFARAPGTRAPGTRAPIVVSSASSGSSRSPATHLVAWASDQRSDEAPADPRRADSAPLGSGVSLSRDTLHRELGRLGAAVHDDARALSSAYFLSGRAGATVELGEVAREDLPGYILHPLFVDATIHLARLLISRDAQGEPSSDDASSLLRIGQVSVDQPGAAVAHIHLAARLDASHRGCLDATLVDASGLVVANLRGLQFGGRAAFEAQLAALRLERVNHAIARAIAHYRSGDDLLESGATSLDLIRIVNNLETEFGWSPDLERLLALRHSEALAAYYASGDGGAQLHDAPAPIPADPAATVAPLSLAQEQLWFLHRVDPQSPRYHIHLRARWRGRLDVPAFREAAQALAARHGSLRTRFAIEQQEPVARTVPNVPIAISHIDLRGLPPSRQASQVELELAGNLRERFDLQNGPLYRISLLQLSPDDHRVAFTFHHLIADGRSIELYLRELIEVYESITAGREARLPTGRLTYGDYARWQRQALAAGAFARDRAYWRAQLTGIPRLLLPDLPADLPGAPEADCVAFSIAPPLLDALKRLARTERTTLPSVLCAAYAHVLRCISGQDDFGIGTAALGRTRREFDDVLGLLSNSVVLRMQLAESTTFRTLLAAVRGVSLQALTHQAVPFVQVVQDVGAEGADGNPLFRAAILSQSLSFPTLHDARALLTWEWDRLDAAPSQSARFDIELLCGELPSGLALQLVYRRRALSQATARFLVQQMVVLLNLAARDPDADLGTLGELEETRRGRWALLAGPAIPYDREAPLHRAIVDQCTRDPGRIALVHRDQSISYGDLDRRTNQLARFLQDRGVAAETLVAVCLDRGIDMVVAMIAVLKAGGAYLPLDPRHPVERRLWVIRDSGAALVLTSTEHASASDSGATELLLDESSRAIAEASVDPVDADVSGRDLAYLIYTSGSTGHPKGVMVEHRNVHNFFGGMTARVPDATGGVWLAATTVAFDISVLELLWTLTRGFRVLIAESSELHFRNHHSVTHLQCTPSIARLLTEHEEGRALLSRVKHLLVGGEALTPALAETLQALIGGTVTNMYGPTETTVWSSTWRVELGAANMSIGEPIANTEFYVLDERGKPVPWGATGELYIAGEGVARGYHGRTEETRARFLPDPFAPGSRMYRTGDIVRSLPNRTLQWLRRADRQVKIAGNRIELGEIEAALRRDPDVRQCAVTKQVLGGEDRLLAFVVPTAPDAARRRALAPEHLQTWKQVWDESYRHAPAENLESDFRGWVRLEDGMPIAQAEMHEWLHTTVASILEWNPRRVLDIGCGAGLLLWQIAPHVEHYHAYDVSPIAIDRLRRECGRRGLGAAVEATVGATGALGERVRGQFDTIVINSVVQYLSNLDELRRLLLAAALLLAPGGRLFVGDVRNYALLGLQYLAIGRARPQIASLQQAIECTEELTIEPSFFVSIARAAFGGKVEIRAKQGRSINELTKYRYDVILGGSDLSEASENVSWSAWNSELERPRQLSQRLATVGSDCLAFSGIPNERLGVERQLATGCSKTRGGEALRASLAGGDLVEVDPEELSRVVRATGFIPRILWAGPQRLFAFDLLAFRPGCEDLARAVIARRMLDLVGQPTPGARCANEPTLARHKRELAAELQTKLRNSLPAYMIPSIIVTEGLELTANGKIDVTALPEMEGLPGPTAAAERAPQTEHEQLLTRVWEDVLGRPIPGVTARFFDLGGTSLAVIRVCIKLEELGHVISPARVFEHPTIEALAQALERGPESAVDLEADGGFEAPPQLSSQPAVGVRAATLLTGATGFVGIHLLEQLLAQTDSPIVCLVRSDDEAHGRARIARAAARFGLSLDLDARVQVVSGAIDRADLGLSGAGLRQLEHGIDTIYHNAAAVNFAAPYSELRKTNVEGTRHLLELACRGRRKAFHHISTLAVADACPASSARPVSEADPTSDFSQLRDGYSQSKWVAERMVRNAGTTAGLAVSIYRLGIVVGSHANGRMPREEAFVRALCAVMNTGACFSAGSRTIEHLSPVDDVARLVVRLSRTADTADRIFHVAHPQGVPLRELLTWTRGYGFRIEEMSMPNWFQALKRRDAYAEMYPIVRRLEKGHMTTLDCTRSLEALTALEDGWGPVDERAYARMLEALIAAGEIAAPELL